MRTRLVIWIAVILAVLGALGLWRASHKPVRHGYWGYINRRGEWVVPPRFADARSFSEGLALVSILDSRPRDKVMKTHGAFINEDGRVVLDLPQGQDAWFHRYGTWFHEGVAAIHFRNGWGYIDRSGRVSIEPRFDQVAEFDAGLAPAKIHGRWGYIDKSGRFVVAPRFDQARAFSEGLAAVELGRRWGYIDRQGAFVVKPRFAPPEKEEMTPYSVWSVFDSGDYETAWDFHAGLAAVRVEDKWGYIDKSGRFVVPPQFTLAGNFWDGLASVMTGDFKTGRSGYIDRTGKWVIKPAYDHAGNFSEGLAAVTSKDMRGYIDKTGRYRITLAVKYRSSAFCGGMALVQGQNYAFGFIDKSGKLVVPYNFQVAEPFHEGLAAVQVR